MKIVTIIPLKKGIFKENLTYFTSKDIESGSIVSVSVRNQKILGLVVAIEDAVGTKSNIKNMSFNLKKVIEVKEHSIFKKEFLKSALLVGEYFVAKKNHTMAALIPSVLKEEYDKVSKFLASPEKIKKSDKNLKSEKLLLQTPFEERISIYKTMIRESFARKKSIFMVLPTESDIENFSKLISKGIESFIFTVHSGVSRKKMLEKLNQIINSTHPVLVIGTPPYLSIPRDDFETIILEHESSNAYRMIARPGLDLRVFVETFANLTGAKLILADTLLRFETISREKLDGVAPLYPMNFRLNFEGEIEIGNREDNREKKFKIVNDKSVEEIKKAIAKKENVFIFSLRKGLATVTVCKDCNEAVICENCSAPLVLYLSRDGKKRMFACNRCRAEASPETVCKRCGSWNLTPLGVGTDTVAEEVEKLFPKSVKVSIFKLNKDSVKNSKDAQKIIKEFEESPGSILIGTEMAFYYLQQKVGLSVIASFDSLWSVPNFKMSEKIIHIILSLTSLTKNKLIIQTKNIEDGALLSVKSDNLISFIREELRDRRRLGYPPFKRFIKISFSGDKLEAGKAKKFLAELFTEYNPQIFTGFIAKQNGKYTTNALLRLDTSTWPAPVNVSDNSYNQDFFRKLSILPPDFEVSVDPEDVL